MLVLLYGIQFPMAYQRIPNHTTNFDLKLKYGNRNVRVDHANNVQDLGFFNITSS